MNNRVDTKTYVEKIQYQEAYDQPLDVGMYLGFLLPNDTVVIRRIEELKDESRAPHVIACPVTRLFK